MPKIAAIAAAGMKANEAILANTAHTLANISTTGFKRSMVVTQTVVSPAEREAGSASSSTGTISSIGTYIGGGVRVAGTVPILTQGDLVTTDQDTDLAIVGDGYFQIEGSDGKPLYTRDGHFVRGPDGSLETIDGLKVIPGITIPETATVVMISRSGLVEAKIPGQIQNQQLGQLQLALFNNPGGLEPLTGNYLAETPGSGAPLVGNPMDTGFGLLHQRTLESSNADAVTEITNLIQTQRAYEMNSKVVTAWDEMQAIISKMGRG